MTTPRHQAALKLARAGIPVFPCIVNGKKPACFNGYKDRTVDEGIINWWWSVADHNLAIVPGDQGLGVVDIDKAGFATWDQLTAIHGEVPTRAVRTPSGGMHLYYRGTLPPSAAKLLGRGLDTRGIGSYVLVAPSYVIETDKGYEGAYSEPDATPIAGLPAWIAERVNTYKTEARKAPDFDDTQTDLPLSIAAARDWLRNKPPAAAGSASETFYEYACRLKDLGISPDRTTELLQAHSPGYAFDDIGQRVANAWDYGENDPGCDRPRGNEEVFPDYLGPEVRDNAEERMAFRTLAWVKVQTYPERDWLWGHYIPAQKPWIMTGPAKTGKTTFLLNLACHIACGVPFLGAETKPRPVAMLIAEDEYRDVRSNIAKIVQDCNLDASQVDANLHIRSVLDDPAEGGHTLINIMEGGSYAESGFMTEVVGPFLQRRPGTVWMVDPLVEFVHFSRYSEHGPRTLVHWLNHISRMGITPLITDHPTVSSIEAGRDIGGSVQMEASFPTVAALKSKGWMKTNPKQQRMSFELKYARYAPAHTPIEFYRIEGSAAYTMEGVPGQTPGDWLKKVYRLILERLDQGLHTNRSNRGEFGPGGIAAALNIAQAEVVRALVDLEGAQWLKYTVVTKGGAGFYERGSEGPGLKSPELAVD